MYIGKKKEYKVRFKLNLKLLFGPTGTFIGSSAVDSKRFLESNASSIRGTLT